MSPVLLHNKFLCCVLHISVDLAARVRGGCRSDHPILSGPSGRLISRAHQCGEDIDELAEFNDGGHETSIMSKTRGHLLKKAGVVTLARIGTSAYISLPALHSLHGKELTFEAVRDISMPYLKQAWADNICRVESLLTELKDDPENDDPDEEGDPTPTQYEIGCALISTLDLERAIYFQVSAKERPT